MAPMKTVFGRDFTKFGTHFDRTVFGRLALIDLITAINNTESADTIVDDNV